MKNYKRVIAGVMAVAVSVAATGSVAYAKANSSQKAETAETQQKDEDKKIERAASDKAAFKDETVYVLCKNDSSVKKVVVSDWLKNAPALKSLNDISSLAEISLSKKMKLRCLWWL